MKHLYYAFILPAIILSACTLVEVEMEDSRPQEEISEEVPVRETKNVTYTGTVQPAGISIYQQGSHRLILPGGKFILLESEDIDLNGYVDEEVQIFGSLRPTVEAGGMIMRVEKITLVASEESVESEESEEPEESKESEETEESEEDDAQDLVEDPEEDQVDKVESEITETGEDAEEEVTEVSEGAEEEASETDEGIEIEKEEDSQNSDAVNEAEETSEANPAVLERIELMARQDYAQENWTQQYCTSHIGYCAPVHKNWWFKSFGATNSTLWHVEFNSEPIEEIYDGPIALDLLAGSIAEKDGTVETTDGMVHGYREWTFGRHFRISGDESLIEAITYITKNITESQ